VREAVAANTVFCYTYFNMSTGKRFSLIFITLFAFLAYSPLVSASVIESEPVGILPTNPFYFVKKIGWSFKRVFTFDPIKKVNLELQVLEKTASEIKKIKEIGFEEEAVIKAVRIYSENFSKLINKMGELYADTDNLNNSEVKGLGKKIYGQVIAHEKIFKSILENHAELYQEISDSIKFLETLGFGS